MDDWESCGLLEMKRNDDAWRVVYAELLGEVLTIYDDESKSITITQVPINHDSSVEVLPSEGHRIFIFRVTSGDTIIDLSTVSAQSIEMWMISLIQIGRGSFSPSERFSVSSQQQAPLFNTTRHSENFSPLETNDYLTRAENLNQRLEAIIVEQSTNKDPWLNHPCGWLRKPDFKRAEQFQASLNIRSGSLSSTSSTNFWKALFASPYRKRWFVLPSKSHFLLYYEGDTELSLLGRIDLTFISEARPSIIRDAPPNALDLVGEEKVFTIAADSFEEMARWAFVINREILFIKDEAHVRSIGESQTIEYDALLNKHVEFPPSILIESIMAHLKPLLNPSPSVSPGNIAKDVIPSRKSNAEPSDSILEDRITNTEPEPSDVTSEVWRIRTEESMLVHPSPQSELSNPDPNRGTLPSKPFESLLQNFYSRVLQCLYTPQQRHVFSHYMAAEVPDGHSSLLAMPSLSGGPHNEELGTRITSTLKKCAFDGCSSMHLLSGAYCRQHIDADEDLSSEPFTFPKAYTTTSIEGMDISHSRLDSAACTSTSMYNHIYRISLREEAQHRAEVLSEQMPSVVDEQSVAMLQRLQEVICHEAGNDTAIDPSELSHLVVQFRQLDVDNDERITHLDIQQLLKSVDPSWASTDDPRIRSLLSESCKDWIASATVDGSEELTFEGYVKALIRKRSDEAINYGYPESVPIPIELMQHPFWDLRSIVCSPCATELAGWIFKRGYAIPVEYMNAWKPRYFKLAFHDSIPYLEYFATMPSKQDRPKGSIAINSIAVVDFSPKTVVELTPSAQEFANQRGIDTKKLIAFKITVRSGRRYTLACTESKAIDWVAEFIRFSNRTFADADWRHCWGSERRTRGRSLRDWINACATMERFSMYCFARKQAQVMLDEARTGVISDDIDREDVVAKLKESIVGLLQAVALSENDSRALACVGIDATAGTIRPVARRPSGSISDGNGTGFNSFVSGFVERVAGYLLSGLALAMNEEFSSHVVSAQTSYHNLFRAATDFEASKIQEDGKSLTLSQYRGKFKYQQRCHVCSQGFKSISLRSAFRKHFCKVCGNVCCSACCTSKLFDSANESYADVCMKCIARRR